MFDKFGEFDSAEELNKAAEGLKEEGDRESLIELAKENGIDPEDAEDYWNSEMQFLAASRVAAIARLKVEKEASCIPNPARDVIYGMAMSMAAESEEDAERFMKRGARIDIVWKLMEDMARKNKTGSMGFACGTDLDLRRMILSVLDGGAKHAKK